ncbi:8-oxo-dGTP diphosphatase [Mesorhizobium sp. M0488]|uniref:8-oxo-dGTP diphosphatase n=1 Tax=unclassified Mesorhizobium TaxID=325217 RepID=UPI003338BFE8
MPLRTVTCLILRSCRLLLQERPAGRIWAGMLNGPGGKIEPGETAAEAVVREVLEETGLRVVDPSPRGSLTLLFPAPQSLELSVEIFVATALEGDAFEREGALSWHALDALPFDSMWADQRYWLTAVLDGFSVEGTVCYELDSLRLTLCELVLRQPATA